MSNEHDTLVCTLRLLFDGKDEKDIARAVHEALGGVNWRFQNAYEDASKCWPVYSVYPDWIEELLDKEYERGELDGWFVGDQHALEYMARSCVDSITDSTYDAIYDDIRSGVSYTLDNKPEWYVSEAAAMRAAEEAGVELNI